MTIVPVPGALCEAWALGDLRCAGDADSELVTEAILWASNELWRYSGYGVCPRTAVFCDRVPIYGLGWLLSSWDFWFLDRCSDCPPFDVLDLGPGPVQEVTSVRLPGEDVDLAATEWVVLDWRFLARVNGQWPLGDVTVTWKAGSPPDVSALSAARVLACEWLKMRNGAKDCRLLKDRPTGKDSFYGIPEVDRWLVSVANDDAGMFNPNRMQARYHITQHA